ncbi:LuxR C-terminal-related transcriptional regulator [Cellulophaga baltica]|uniref:helix-turn-helix and ligand-binding sensor domain-containing protein n=1 Tax=Cellulophaga TaxID=104264 RepID=UPI001C07B5CD|nr:MULTISPECIES: triple tyrosine motif-containing protein [Cellulophaga]MBU2996938.1 LuxR C-terminal-related transcriptional regulator [Cellulophaga baltica]MDO6768336.1 triple tyrosine motif-containing protein [Cellulophaga sp. 1_MG-2023]
MRNLIQLLLLLICVNFSFSQELPPILNFTPTEYNGENQNWSISQSKDKYIYVGNNRGLLEYNGAVWQSYQSSNGSYIRAVATVENTVFTGCYMDFGFWTKDEYGSLSYQSLKSQLPTPMIEDEEIWNILHLDNWVLFQSLQRIYIYNLNDETFNIVNSVSNRARIYNVDGAVYFQQSGKGIFKIENGKALLFSEDDIFKTKTVIDIFKTVNGVTALTENANFYTLTNSGSRIWDFPALEKLKAVNVYSSIQLRDGSFMLGTISDGLYHISANGDLLEIINQKKGLTSNTVHAIYEDVEGDVWLALNNGISAVNLDTPFFEYIDNIGKIGVVYTASVFNGNLYLGTNQGLFYKKKNSNNDFEFVKNTNGQVWALKVIDETLFCGHNSGTFIVNEAGATKIASVPGTWDIKPVPNADSLLIQGNYRGLSVLHKQNGNWTFRNNIEGFDISTRFFEILNSGELIVNHGFKGDFRLTFDEAITKVVSVNEIPSMGTETCLLSYEDDIIYKCNNGIFRYNQKNSKFEKDTIYTNLLYADDEKPIGVLNSDQSSDRLWAFTSKNIIAISKGKLNSTPEVEKISIPDSFRKKIGVLGFENITELGVGKYLIGISDGYLTLDLNKIVKNQNYTIKINYVGVKERDSLNASRVVINSSLNEFKNTENTFHFKFSVPRYNKYSGVTYEYQLNGQNDEWSEASKSSEVTFENLPFGTYEFKVKAKVGNITTENIASYSFEVLRPWYLSNLMLITYFLAFILLGYLIHRLYRNYYKKQQKALLKENQKRLKRKKIKSEKKLIQIKNEKLNQEIDNKNRELAISTMSIIKKNEFLNNLKTQLEQVKSTSQISNVIKVIDKNINNDDDWKLFEDAFNNADKDFLNKIKAIHPTLTPNDLRLCAYLRLNLSSKEIAPLLNISVRSVEVKRYRLRKKMELPHEISLTNYILKLQ